MTTEIKSISIIFRRFCSGLFWGLMYVLIFPLLLIMGPILLWAECFNKQWKVLFTQYSDILIGEIKESTRMWGSDFSSDVGITFRYQFDNTMFERVRHFIRLPISVDDCSPDPFPPEEYKAGMPIQLIMIPGRPATALPADVVYKLKGSNVGYDSVQKVVGNVSESCCCGPFVFFFGFIATIIVTTQETGLPPTMLGYIMLVWYILGFPVSYWRNKILFREVLGGGTPVFQEENSDVALEGGNLECQGESGDKS